MTTAAYSTVTLDGRTLTQQAWAAADGKGVDRSRGDERPGRTATTS